MDWKFFLENVSKTLLRSKDLLDEFSSHSSDWLGFDGIAEEAIQLHEARLGTSLPTSYKSFLKASNGFRQLNCFIWDIWPVEKIDWLKNVDPELIDIWCSFDDDAEVTDERYFVYDEKEHPPFRTSYLKSCLTISGKGDATVLLLNPEIKFGDEWEAWMFAPWNLGPTRYQSFEKLMAGEFENYLKVVESRSF